MPKMCEGCGFHTADNAPAACPGCGRPLKFTLLGPPNRNPDPLPGVPTGVTGRLGNNPEIADGSAADPPTLLGFLLSYRTRGPAVFVAVTAAAVAAAVAVSGRPAGRPPGAAPTTAAKR